MTIWLVTSTLEVIKQRDYKVNSGNIENQGYDHSSPRAVAKLKADSKPLGCMAKCILNHVKGLGKVLL